MRGPGWNGALTIGPGHPCFFGEKVTPGRLQELDKGDVKQAMVAIAPSLERDYVLMELQTLGFRLTQGCSQQGTNASPGYSSWRVT